MHSYSICSFFMIIVTIYMCVVFFFLLVSFFFLFFFLLNLSSLVDLATSVQHFGEGKLFLNVPDQ